MESAAKQFYNSFKAILDHAFFLLLEGVHKKKAIGSKNSHVICLWPLYAMVTGQDL